MTPRTIPLLTSDKSSYKLYLMQKNLCKLITLYGFKVNELKNKVRWLPDRPLIELYKAYQLGDYTTILFKLLKRRK